MWRPEQDVKLLNSTGAINLISGLSQLSLINEGLVISLT